MYWATDLSDDEYKFDQTLLLNEGACEIEEEFTFDMELFFTRQDVRDLFDYSL